LFKQRFAPTTTLMNELGTTETGALCRMFIDNSSQPTDDIVAAGYAAEDKKILLLDAGEEEVGRGQIGEITVKSRYLARGYWRLPAFTRDAFVPDAADPDMRMYRTDDLGRLHSDGCLEHLGRKDYSLKVRGRLVNTMSVDAVLRSYAAIDDVVVVGRTDARGNAILVAYMVGHTSDPLSISALRRALQATLPRDLIPDRFVQLEALSRTPTGKIDRQALPPPPAARPTFDAPYVGPETPLEQKLTALWTKALGVDRIGRHDSFVDLSGHSLLAIELFSDIEALTGRRLPPELLFEASTIAALAERLGQTEPARDLSRALPLQPMGEKPILFVVSMVMRLVYCLSLVRHLGLDQPVYGLRATDSGDDGLPDHRVEDMAKHCIEMMRRVQPDGPYRIMGFSADGLLAFEIAHVLHRQGIEVCKMILIDSDLPATSATIASQILRKPLKALRLAWSLIGRSIGLATSDGPIDLNAARASAHFRYRPKPYPGSAILIIAADRA